MCSFYVLYVLTLVCCVLLFYTVLSVCVHAVFYSVINDNNNDNNNRMLSMPSTSQSNGVAWCGRGDRKSKDRHRRANVVQREPPPWVARGRLGLAELGRGTESRVWDGGRPAACRSDGRTAGY